MKYAKKLEDIKMKKNPDGSVTDSRFRSGPTIYSPDYVKFMGDMADQKNHDVDSLNPINKRIYKLVKKAR